MYQKYLALALGIFMLGGLLARAQEYLMPDATPQEAKTADQLAWEASVAPKYKTWAPLRYVKEDPKLPRVLLIGDSISVGYTTRVQEALKGKANVWRVPINGGSTLVGLENMEKWLSWRDKWDVIHFNFGLHDISREREGRPDVSGTVKVPVEQYAANLEKLVTELEKTGAKLIWATTTPVPEDAAGRLKGDEVTYNAAAAKVMQAHGVQINDLHGYILPRLDVAQKAPDVHFLDAGSQLLADQVAQQVLKALAPEPDASANDASAKDTNPVAK